MARLRLTLFGLDRALEHHQIDFLPFGHAALAVVQHYRKVLSEGTIGR